MSFLNFKLTDFPQNKYFQHIIQTGKQFYNDPRETFSSWSIKQKMSFICVSSLISVHILLKMKSNYIEYNLRKNGYRKCDLTTQGWELLQEYGSSPTVCGFEICSDIFTIHHLKQFIKQLMKSFINFRSQIYKINGKFYFKEEFDPNTQDLDKYITNISMECKNINQDDTDAIIEEKILQQTLKYLNDNKQFNVKWNTYKRAHIDAIYFHFKPHKKCVIFFRFNHSLGDGILTSTLIALVQNQLFNHKYKNKQIDYTQSDDILPLITDILGNKVPNYSIWNTIYHYMHYPVAWVQVIYQILTPKMDRKCIFRGEYEGNNKLAVGRPISVTKFKSVAKQYNGTVNDLFQAIAMGSLRRYAEKHKCPIFSDRNFDGIFTKIGIVNRRPLSPVRFAKELEIFAKYGTNSNKLDFTPYKVNIKNASVVEAQQSFSKIKYGYTAKAIRSLVFTMALIPGGIDFVFHGQGNGSTLCSSNMKGPATLIPLPTEKEENEEKIASVDNNNNNNSYVSWLFGMAVPAMLPISFTLLTYNKHIRIGVLTDSGSVKDPDLLMECFVEEWNQYDI